MAVEALERRDLLSAVPLEAESLSLFAAGLGEPAAAILSPTTIAPPTATTNLPTFDEPLTGIGGDTEPWVVTPTTPPGFTQGVGWMIAVMDWRRSDPATVEVAWMRLHARVNGQDVIIAVNDYGTGAGQQAFVDGDVGSRINWFVEEPANVAAGFTDIAMVVRPSDRPDYGYHWWNQPRGEVPSNATHVWAEALVRVSGSAVVEIGTDYYGPGRSANGSGSGFIYFESPDWQVITSAKPASTWVTEGRPWQNMRDAYDTSGDGRMTPLDALLVINVLNRGPTGPMPAQLPPGAPHIDVSGDNQLTPLDALLVINRLNAASMSSSAPAAASLMIETAALPAEMPTYEQAVADGWEAIASAELRSTPLPNLDNGDIVAVPGKTAAATAQTEDALSTAQVLVDALSVPLPLDSNDSGEPRVAAALAPLVDTPDEGRHLRRGHAIDDPGTTSTAASSSAMGRSHAPLAIRRDAIIDVVWKNAAEPLYFERWIGETLEQSPNRASD